MIYGITLLAICDYFSDYYLAEVIFTNKKNVFENFLWLKILENHVLKILETLVMLYT